MADGLALETRLKAAWRFGLQNDRVVLAAACLGVLLFQGLAGPRPLDDAFITFRYARSLSQGAGWVYNPGERVQGSTTPLYTLLMALGAAGLGSASLPAFSFAVALLADSLSVWIFYRLAKRIFGSPGLALLGASLLLLQPLRLNVARGGMETSLFVFFLLAMAERTLAGRHSLATVLACLAILTRIDALLAVAPFFAHFFFTNRKAALKAGLGALALLAPWYLWAAWYFGNPLPQSILAKQAVYSAGGASSALLMIFTFLGTGTVGPYRQVAWLVPGLVLAFFFLAQGAVYLVKNCRAALLLAAYPFLYFGVMATAGAPLFFVWYYLPLMPGLLILWMAGILHVARAVPPASRKALWGLSAGLLLLVPALFLRFSPGWAIERGSEEGLTQACPRLSQTVRPGQTVLAPDIGVLGWCLGQARILDPVGLVSPQSLPYLAYRRPDELFSSRIIADLKPDYVIAWKGMIQDKLADPAFLAAYRLEWSRAAPAGDNSLLVLARR